VRKATEGGDGGRRLRSEEGEWSREQAEQAEQARSERGASGGLQQAGARHQAGGMAESESGSRERVSRAGLQSSVRSVGRARQRPAVGGCRRLSTTDG
jgi:hypothetical protein